MQSMIAAISGRGVAPRLMSCAFFSRGLPLASPFTSPLDDQFSVSIRSRSARRGLARSWNLFCVPFSLPNASGVWR